jgi:hypothetical protein
MFSEGMDYVFVGGEIAWEGGLTQKRNGKVLNAPV